ncbi:MAG: response regulator transcription factor [Oscillospiraceae bacterium]|nr:response regulator transcription factor [Oscillospiraceae bacterium]
MIFCVEDDISSRELMIYTLKSAGFDAKGFPESTDFWKALETETPELIMLDIMLPGEDGIEILKKLRKKTKTADIPVIMATAKGTEFDKVTGLDTGADDYLVKPFGMMEMISHIKAVLRRTAPKTSKNVLSTGKLSLNPDEHAVFVDGKKVVLTFKEFELLKIFMENPGRVFSRDALLEKVWGADYYGETRTVDVHIGTLRTKLGECGDYIETVRGVGYRMEERH